MQQRSMLLTLHRRGPAEESLPRCSRGPPEIQSAALKPPPLTFAERDLQWTRECCRHANPALCLNRATHPHHHRPADRSDWPALALDREARPRSPPGRPDHRQTRLQAVRAVHDHDRRQRDREPHRLAPASLTPQPASAPTDIRPRRTRAPQRASDAPHHAARVAATAAASIRIAYIQSGDNTDDARLSRNATCDGREAGSDRQLDDPRLDTAIRDLDLRHRDR